MFISSRDSVPKSRYRFGHSLLPSSSSVLSQIQYFKPLSPHFLPIHWLQGKRAQTFLRYPHSFPSDLHSDTVTDLFLCLPCAFRSILLFWVRLSTLSWTDTFKWGNEWIEWKTAVSDETTSLVGYFYWTIHYWRLRAYQKIEAIFLCEGTRSIVLCTQSGDLYRRVIPFSYCESHSEGLWDPYDYTKEPGRQRTKEWRQQECEHSFVDGTNTEFMQSWELQHRILHEPLFGSPEWKEEECVIRVDCIQGDEMMRLKYIVPCLFPMPRWFPEHYKQYLVWENIV